MSNSGKSDHDFVNFDEQWEINYIVRQYPEKDRPKIRELLNNLKKQGL